MYLIDSEKMCICCIFKIKCIILLYSCLYVRLYLYLIKLKIIIDK